MSERPAAAPTPEDHREPAFVGLLAALVAAVASRLGVGFKTLLPGFW